MFIVVHIEAADGAAGDEGREMVTRAQSNLQQAEQELFDHARDYAGDEWCQAMRDEVNDTCLSIRRAAQRAYDVTELYHDGMDRDLIPEMIANIATEYDGELNGREAAILHAAVRVLIEGGKV